ncbi:hypothetical protein M9458_010039, partial [Cirrhinus mrigala]
PFFIMTVRCWRTITRRLPGICSCRGPSTTFWPVWTTWTSNAFASWSSRPYWPPTSRNTLTSWLNSTL